MNCCETLSQVKLASHSPLVEVTYILTKLTTNVLTNRPYTSSARYFLWMVVGSVQMADRLQMVKYLNYLKLSTFLLKTVIFNNFVVYLYILLQKYGINQCLFKQRIQVLSSSSKKARLANSMFYLPTYRS